MKNLNALNLPEDSPLAIQEFIYNALCSAELIIVCYTPVRNSKLKVLTLVVNKQNYDAIASVLQPQIDALHALRKYDTLITVNYHKVSSNDSQFHFSYLQLHLKPCSVIYSNHLKRWNSLFQNFYCTDNEKALNHFKNYNTEIESRVKEAIAIFVIPLVKQKVFQAAHVALLEVFSYYFDMLKNMLLPKSVHHKYNEQEFTWFVNTYYPEFSKILNQISKLKTTSYNDQTQYMVGETPKSIFDKTMKRTLELQTNALKHLNVFYTKRISAQLCDNSNEEVLLKQLIGFLVGVYKIDAIYLISKEKLNQPHTNDAYKFNLLILAPSLRVQQHDTLVEKVSNHFKGKVEVFCLIHTLEWLQNNEYTYQFFFKNTIIPQKVLYLKNNLVINDKVLEIKSYSHTKEMQKKYYEERLACISPWFSTFQMHNLVYQSGHLLLLKNMVQQLILGLLYQKVHYIPAIYSCKYLLQVLQALLPEMYNQCIHSNDVQTILALLSTPMNFIPKTNQMPKDIDQLACAKTLFLCEKLFNEIQMINN